MIRSKQFKSVISPRTISLTLLAVMFAVLFVVSARPTHATPPGGYTLVWHDEFNSGTDSKETVGSGVDPAYWTYTTGAGGFGNNELQTYTTSTANCSIVSDAAAPNGTALYLTATNSGSIYDSALINTTASNVIGTQPQFGYFESMIEQPVGSGMWPAWWMEGVDSALVGWPECGEQDIFELFGDNPTNEFSDYFYNATDYAANYGGNVTVSTGAYNTYALLWTPTTQTNYYNGTAYISDTNVGGPFLQPFYFILDLAVGGNPGGLGANTVFPSSFKIGYVRVYQPTGVPMLIPVVFSSVLSVATGGSTPRADISARHSAVISTSAAASEGSSCSTLRAPMIGAVMAG
jgi:beta-glucanase (GH16 family)